MDGYQFITAMFSSMTVLAWPITIAVICWIFRDDIRKVIPKVIPNFEFQHGDTKIIVGKVMDEVRQHDAIVIAKAIDAKPIDAPFETRNLQGMSSDEIRVKVSETTKAMRKMDEEFARERSRAIPSPERWEQDVQSLLNQSDRQREKWMRELQPTAHALLAILDSKTDAGVADAHNGQLGRIVIKHGILAGPSPLGEAANYLEGLARQLP